MSKITVECQGLNCPEPVLRVKRALEAPSGKPEFVEVLVDNHAARENVTRFLAANGYAASVGEAPGGMILIEGQLREPAKQDSAVPPCPAPEASASGEKVESNIVVLVASELFGTGDETLGGKLMVNFLGALPEMDGLWRVILLNGGVKLAAHGSPALEKLQALEASGVTVLACGVCLEHFGLLDKKAVGQTTNMLDVVTSLALAGKVIRV